VTAPRTLFEKIWDRHVVTEGPGGRALLYIDRHLLHEGATHAFERLARAGRRPRRTDRMFATADHYVSTAPPGGQPANDEISGMLERLGGQARAAGVTYFGPGDVRRGIVHVIGPEQGLTIPGITLVCGDSHTATHGAFGTLAFGIGSTEVEHAMATQTLWQRRPKLMRVTMHGRLGHGGTAKDTILALIAQIGAGGATGHAIEYAGPAVRAMSMDERMTVCNMSIEAGARCGMVAPDDTTFAYLEGRPFAPRGEAWARAVVSWRTLPGDDAAVFDREVVLDASAVAPTVTWGTSPEHAVPITARVPDPARIGDPVRRAAIERALAYMDLPPGLPLEGLPVDRVFIGSCTNSRLDDLRAAAAVVKARRARVPAWVVPGSGLVKQAAEAEGLDRLFRGAGFEWREPGCSMCVGMNGETAAECERVASTTNRNFEGRQGKDARTHLMSPAMAAAAAVTGRLTDVRRLAG
jgi:3-isopropylmalate/(R)-2-methylmalate dehydratase large subunit